MTDSLILRPLPQFATVTFRGSDARTFLQGQLSNDLNLLSADHALLASCNSAQGRVQCIMTLIQKGDDIVAVLPASLVATLIKRLKFYVLRAKVTIEDSSQTLHVAQVRDGASPATLPAQPGDSQPLGDMTVMRWWSTDPRWLVLHTHTELVANDASPDQHDWHEWQQHDIAAGLPQVYPDTHEHFVAQMLNLDALNGISFNKGCYTGQEIIARAHFRGTVKRRLFRFHAATGAPAPGTRVVNGEHPAGEVVDAVNTADGCELLAVISLDQLPTQRGGALTLEHADPATQALRMLPLPYALPA